MPYGSIYKITNRISGRSYIGQTIQSVALRCRQHFQRAFNNHHKGALLQKAICECGVSVFETETLAIAETKEELDRLELYFIQFFRTQEPHGYNKMTGRAHGTHSAATKQKISLSHKGRKQPQHVIELNRQRMLGTTVSPEIREKISRKLKGHKRSKEAIAKTANALRGRPRPKVHKPWGWPKGVPKPTELRERLRIANLGKKASLETREKMSQSQKKKWIERHANSHLHASVVIPETT